MPTSLPPFLKFQGTRLALLLSTLAFVAAVAALPARAGQVAHATFGRGCFWASQQEFESLRGVVSAEPGFAGGTAPAPSYEQVCTGTTGHAEVVRITYDPAVISYRQLLTAFFAAHDPTTPDRSDPDVGPQYRSIILTEAPEQTAEARREIAALTRTNAFRAPIVTQVKPLGRFYPAEGYHRHFCDHHPGQPYCTFVVGPEVARFRHRFAGWLKPGLK